MLNRYQREFYLHCCSRERDDHVEYISQGEIDDWCRDHGYTEHACDFIQQWPSDWYHREYQRSIGTIKEVLLEDLYGGRTLPDDLKEALGVYSMVLFFLELHPEGSSLKSLTSEFRTLTWEEADRFGLVDSYWEEFGLHRQRAPLEGDVLAALELFFGFGCADAETKDGELHWSPVVPS